MSQYIYTDMVPELHIKIKSLKCKVELQNGEQRRATGSVVVQQKDRRKSTSAVDGRITSLQALRPTSTSFANNEPKKCII